MDRMTSRVLFSPRVFRMAAKAPDLSLDVLWTMADTSS